MVIKLTNYVFTGVVSVVAYEIMRLMIVPVIIMEPHNHVTGLLRES